MRHVDPDVLALLALGERVADDGDRVHLAECGDCSNELAHLSRVARVGRSTFDAELLQPPARVWDRITDELGMTPVAPAAQLEPRRRRWLPVAIAAVMVGVLALGGLVTWQTLQPTPSVVLASASLAAFPDWPDASGTAVVEEAADGSRVVRVELDVPESHDGYTEVWLISSDATRLISLGTVEGSSGTFAIPAGVDLSIYDLVDVSAEPIDGDPTHSGDSIVRGQLS